MARGKDSVATFYELNDPGSTADEGMITLDWLKANTPLEEADVFLCGPKPFLRLFVAALADEIYRLMESAAPLRLAWPDSGISVRVRLLGRRCRL